MVNIKEKELLRRVRRFSQSLAERYGIKRVYLFGSLAGGLFLKGSDIDLAVEGMDFEDYLRVLAEHREIIGTHLDILHLDLCKPKLKEAVLKESKVLYEKKIQDNLWERLKEELDLFIKGFTKLAAFK